MGETAVVFPGQGCQVVGMARDVAERSARARAVFDRAGRLLGFDLARLCFEGPAADLARTDLQQPAIFVASVALWEALLEAGASRAQFARAGGLSLGEYTALYAAGAVAFDDALRLVHRRGTLMQTAASATPGGMVSLVGADDATARNICDRARGDDVLAPANFNGPGQVVISGSEAACARASEAASELGCRAVVLPVAGAFHSPLMAPAAAGLRDVLDATTFREPAIPVIANADAAYHGDAPAMRDALCRQLTSPVLWRQCVERMIADGVTRFLEVGPGRVLTGLIRKINRQVRATPVHDANAIAAVVVPAGADATAH
ncbi:MAG: ACP S-malonyltransferase [Phycisphaerae bacterium]